MRKEKLAGEEDRRRRQEEDGEAGERWRARRGMQSKMCR